MKSGTRTTAPVSSLAGFWPPVAVSPRRPGSVSTTLRSMCGGGMTCSGTLFHRVTMQVMPSFSHCALSPTAALLAAYCSKLSGTMKWKKSPSEYRYCMSVSTTSAASTLSPDLNVRSMVRPVLEVAHPHAVERLTLAGLDHLVLDDRVGIVVEQDLETGT